LCIIFVYSFASTHFQLVLTATPSLPYRLFILSKRSRPSPIIPRKGAYVLFYKDFTEVKIIKQVRGVPGSKIHCDLMGRLWIDDFCVGTIHKMSLSGKTVNPLKVSIIPEGYVFVHAPHDRSFDSRYEEFGLVPISSILGAGVAIL
jgi:conjugal transfer pilin signal peptidase TrbI